MSWFRRKELVTCAACDGSGKCPPPAGPLSIESGPGKQIMMLMQGICLACEGAGVQRR